MGTKVKVSFSFKPKYKAPKYSVKKSTQYHIFRDSNGQLRIQKRDVRSINVNKG